MKKTLVILGFIAVLIGGMVLGWRFTKQSKPFLQQDYAKVYNTHEKQIATITNHQKISRLSSVLGELGTARKVHQKTSKKIQLVRHFKIIQTHPSAKIDAFIYRNHTVTVKNLPVIHSGTWDLSNNQYQKLIDLQ